MIKLDLEINEVNVVLVALSKLPFEQVIDVITKIRQQADPQVEAIGKAEAALAQAKELPQEVSASQE
jgi:hypothetical protein